METFFKAIAENPQYAAILAASITALGTIVAALIARKNHKEKKETLELQDLVFIPPQIDPINHLKTNLARIKDIDDMDFDSDEYYDTLAKRLTLKKNNKTIIKISRRAKHDI